MNLMKEWAKGSVGFGPKGTGTKILRRIGDEGDRVAATAGRARHKIVKQGKDLADLPSNIRAAATRKVSKGMAIVAEGLSRRRKVSTNSNELKEFHKLQKYSYVLV